MCGAAVSSNARRCLACGEVLSGTTETPRELPGIQAILSGSSKYPNVRLAAFAIALPVITLAALIAIEATVTAVLGHTVPESVAILGMYVLAASANVPLVVVRFTCWRTFRDYRRRIRVAPSSSTPSAASGSNGPAVP